MSNDIVIDTLQALAGILKAAGAPVMPSQIAAAERIVKGNWGGDRVYVAKTGEDVQREVSARNAAIRRDWARGNQVGLLARRYGLSKSRIRQILSPDKDGAADCLTDCAEVPQSAEHGSNRTDDRAGRTDGRRHSKVAKEPA